MNTDELVESLLEQNGKPLQVGDRVINDSVADRHLKGKEGVVTRVSKSGRGHPVAHVDYGDGVEVPEYQERLRLVESSYTAWGH